MKACCGFGHRNVFENISSKLDNAVEEAIVQGCEMFYTGAMGEFDSLFSSAVRSAKKAYPHIKLICVKPYFTNDINTNREPYTSLLQGFALYRQSALLLTCANTSYICRSKQSVDKMMVSNKEAS